MALLEKFIKIASLSMYLNNIYAAKAIYTGISHPAISRMTRTFGSISRDSKLKFNKLHAIVSMDNNGVSYRTHFKNTSSPCVPYLGLHTKDLVFILDGNPNFLQRDGDQIVNFQKLYMIWETVSDVMHGLHSTYKIRPHPQMRKWFLLSAPVLHESQIFLWSKR